MGASTKPRMSADEFTSPMRRDLPNLLDPPGIEFDDILPARA